jgi:hypothetical protein
MPVSSIALRLVIEYESLLLVSRLATALEEAEMAATSELLMEKLSGGEAITTVIRDGSLRSALRPFAELMLRDLLEIARQPGLPVNVRDSLARKAMADAGYA